MTRRFMIRRVLSFPSVPPMAFSAATLTIFAYARFAGNGITVDRIPTMLVLGHLAMAMALSLFGIGVAGSLFQLAALARRSVSSPQPRSLEVIGTPLLHSQGRFRFLAVFLVYFVVFAWATGIFVIRPGQDFTASYGVAVPSVIVLSCCGEPGVIPAYVIYVAQGFGILLTPGNLLFALAVSVMASLSITISLEALSARRGSARGMAGPGAAGVTGFIAACPTCAGQVLLAGLVGSGASAFALALTPLQAYLSVGSIAILFLALHLQGRLIARNRRMCSIPTRAGA